MSMLPPETAFSKRPSDVYSIASVAISAARSICYETSEITVPFEATYAGYGIDSASPFIISTIDHASGENLSQALEEIFNELAS
jgi:hypothetical protein